ncbi:MAG: hypothetical protein HQK49_16625 [Oligoflexia bacterium]|nr:hypothetical protein [Oligoflexia bacterium]
MILKKDKPIKNLKVLQGAEGVDYDIEEYSFKNIRQSKDHRAFSFQYSPSDKNQKVKILKSGSDVDVDVANYELPAFNEYQDQQMDANSDVVRFEMDTAKEKNFQISTMVQRFRGMRKQEEIDNRVKFEQELHERLEMVKAQWMQLGYEEGKKNAINEVKKMNEQIIAEKMKDFVLMLEEVMSVKKEILKQQKQQVYDLVRSLTKWVILRELKDDGYYVNRLLEKLVLELDTQENLLIMVNKEAFSNMPDVLKEVEKKLGELKNIRVEPALESSATGLIIESSSAILDGSFESQMKELDKLFATVDDI